MTSREDLRNQYVIQRYDTELERWVRQDPPDHRQNARNALRRYLRDMPEFRHRIVVIVIPRENA